MSRRILLPGLILLVAGGCSSEPQPAANVTKTSHQEEQMVAAGQRLYAANCARCHGLRAEGAPNWQKTDAKGKYPAPPLDGSGHAWHHPNSALKSVIKVGTVHMGGNMPAWGDKLSDADIEAVVAWFQSLWPQEVYQAWAEMDRRAEQDGE